MGYMEIFYFFFPDRGRFAALTETHRTKSQSLMQRPGQVANRTRLRMFYPPTVPSCSTMTVFGIFSKADIFVGQFFWGDRPVVRQSPSVLTSLIVSKILSEFLGRLHFKTTFPSSETRLPGGARRLALSALTFLVFVGFLYGRQNCMMGQPAMLQA